MYNGNFEVASLVYIYMYMYVQKRYFSLWSNIKLKGDKTEYLSDCISIFVNAHVYILI